MSRHTRDATRAPAVAHWRSLEIAGEGGQRCLVLVPVRVDARVRTVDRSTAQQLQARNGGHGPAWTPYNIVCTFICRSRASASEGRHGVEA